MRKGWVIGALLALAALPASDDVATALVGAYPKFQDRYLEAAAIGAIAKDPMMFLTAAFKAANSTGLAELVTQATKLVATEADAALMPKVLELAANAPDSASALKRAALDSLSVNFKGGAIWNDALKGSLRKLIGSGNPGVQASALPRPWVRR